MPLCHTYPCRWDTQLHPRFPQKSTTFKYCMSLVTSFQRWMVCQGERLCQGERFLPSAITWARSFCFPFPGFCFLVPFFLTQARSCSYSSFSWKFHPCPWVGPWCLSSSPIPCEISLLNKCRVLLGRSSSRMDGWDWGEPRSRELWAEAMAQVQRKLITPAQILAVKVGEQRVNMRH